MSTEPTERKTVDLPGTKDKPYEPSYFIDDGAKAALGDLQEGDLLQLAVDFGEGEIQFINLSRQVAPDSVGTSLASPSPMYFYFYHYPESGDVVLIWTRYPATSSSKKMHTQNRLRRDLTCFGRTDKSQLQVFSREDATRQKLQDAIASSALSAQE
ncbi:hypothetical protein F66182_6047 [Fusarium sp. NRRL 66182]|nr:hypothetical protein F66182_6047 [Fusarium sp. NRRL 66182]